MFLGNMYSMTSDLTKSVFYFKNAVRINPFHVTPWTLLGYDYAEMKNLFAAIMSHRQVLSKLNIISKRHFKVILYNYNYT